MYWGEGRISVCPIEYRWPWPGYRHEGMLPATLRNNIAILTEQSRLNAPFEGYLEEIKELIPNRLFKGRQK